jgi:hypothetical protein
MTTEAQLRSGRLTCAALARTQDPIRTAPRRVLPDHPITTS